MASFVGLIIEVLKFIVNSNFCFHIYMNTDFVSFLYCQSTCSRKTVLITWHLCRLMIKTTFCICKNKTQISFAVTAKLIIAFVFATRIAQFFFFPNPKFPAFSHLLYLCSSVCVGPVRKPHCWFSHETAHLSVRQSS